MPSNKLFENMLIQYKKITGKEIGIIDENGNITYCTEPEKIGEYKIEVLDEISVKTDRYIKNGYTYKPLESSSKVLEEILYISGDDEETYRIISMLAISLSNIKTLYDEKYNKAAFIKNIILDNILPGEIYIKSKELKFAENIERIIYLIRFDVPCDYSSFDVIQNMFPDKQKDFVISIDESSIALLREVKLQNVQDPNTEIERVAKEIVDTVTSELFSKIMVGIGSVVTDIKDLSRSFKEAQVALEVGKVFDIEKSVINYKNLGIGRIVYQLPTTLCEVFLQEVFSLGSLESLDRESLTTIQSFFENNLNVSETSRKLFVHRNTLVYRLEKIKKLTGLDLREFEHAIIFKVALMVKKYLSSKPTKY